MKSQNICMVVIVLHCEKKGMHISKSGEIPDSGIKSEDSHSLENAKPKVYLIR